MGTSLTGGGNYGRGGNSDSAAPAASHLNYQVNNTPTNVLGSEEALVDDMCAAGGMRPIPDAQDLRKFVEAASNMDGLKIAELMMSRLVGGLRLLRVFLHAAVVHALLSGCF